MQTKPVMNLSTLAVMIDLWYKYFILCREKAVVFIWTLSSL